MREETRRRFHDDLAELQTTLYREADLATAAVERSVESLVHRNNELAHAVIDGDFMGQVHPAPEGDPHRAAIAERNPPLSLLHANVGSLAAHLCAQFFSRIQPR